MQSHNDLNIPMSSQAYSFQAPTHTFLQPESNLTMADLAKEAVLNANPLHPKAHLAPFTSQKEVLLHFLPFAQTVIDFAE